MATFSYDSAARLAGQGFAGASTSYGYDPISRLASLGHGLAGTAADQSLGFLYNPASQIRTRTASNDAFATNTAYNVNRPYSVNGLNQYTAAGSASFLYDDNGNLRADGATNYFYDAENRLVSASGATGATLSYDPLGRLFQVSGGGTTTQFLHDGDELVAEYNGSGTLLRRYAHGLGNDDPVLWYEGSGLTIRRSLFADHQGSIVAVADSGGNALAINGYDAWGIPNVANQGRFGYTGQVWLSEIGMWHYKARIYSPTLGRFLQTDPLGYDDQMNLYTYVGNDPVNKSDPSGMYECKTAADCKVAQQAIAQIRAARDFYRSSRPGSNVPRSSLAVGALNKTLGSIGSKGDGGVSFKEGTPADGTSLGQYSYRDNQITMSSSRIAAAGRTVGEVAAHEVQHYRQREDGLTPMAGEIRPILIELLVAIAPGGSVNYPTSSRDYVRGRFAAYCRLPARYCNPAFERVWNAEAPKPF